MATRILLLAGLLGSSSAAPKSALQHLTEVLEGNDNGASMFLYILTCINHLRARLMIDIDDRGSSD
eukprot:SAG22_NODE_17918_length_296_cov_1.035533_1_plen_66_part_00